MPALQIGDPVLVQAPEYPNDVAVVESPPDADGFCRVLFSGRGVYVARVELLERVEPLKRYLMFAGDHGTGQVGWEWFYASFATLAEARDRARLKAGQYDVVQIIDSLTGKFVPREPV